MVKQLGLGMAVAVLIDATVVRMVLVPAMMAMLGRLSWWMPAWLERLLPTIDAERGDATATPATAPVAEPAAPSREEVSV